MVPIHDSYPACQKVQDDSDDDDSSEDSSSDDSDRHEDDDSDSNDDALVAGPAIDPMADPAKPTAGSIEWRVPLWLRNGTDYYIEIGSKSEVFTSGNFTIMQVSAVSMRCCTA